MRFGQGARVRASRRGGSTHVCGRSTEDVMTAEKRSRQPLVQHHRPGPLRQLADLPRLVAEMAVEVEEQAGTGSSSGTHQS